MFTGFRYLVTYLIIAILFSFVWILGNHLLGITGLLFYRVNNYVKKLL